MNLEALKYPIGKFRAPSQILEADRAEYLKTLAELPQKLMNAVIDLSDNQLDTPYRPDGWTIRQVVHHLADSHMNSLIRFKWALTEDNPIIKAYDENSWAVLIDSKMPVDSSFKIIEGVHARLVELLKQLSEEEWSRTFVHPEHGRTVRLDLNLTLYAWHSKHHLAHITELRKREGWD